VKQIVFSKTALRTLLRMPAGTARLIRSKIDQYASDPAALANNVNRLQGPAGVLRLRVGDWRILFTETGEVIAIVRIAARGGAYD
jgi:mRNA interferase RelE/StbE